MNYKIISIPTPLQGLLESYKRLTDSNNYNPDVLDFLETLRENIKWAIEMNDPRPLPLEELRACLNQNLTQNQVSKLIDWVGREMPLEFWVKKFNQDNPNIIRTVDTHINKELTDRITTFENRIVTFLEDEKLLINSADSLVGYATILCDYPDRSFKTLISCLNDTHQAFATDVMKDLFKIQSTESLTRLLTEWGKTQEFLLHPHFDSLAETYLVHAIKHSDLDNLTHNLVEKIFDNRHYQVMHSVFRHEQESVISFDDKKRFAYMLLNYSVSQKIQKNPRLEFILNHLYKLSQGSGSARLVFQVVSKVKDEKAVNVLNLKTKLANQLMLQDIALDSIQLPILFHPLFYNLRNLRLIFQDKGLKTQIQTLFLNIIKSSAPEKTIQNPEAAQEKIDGIKTKLWQLNINIHDKYFIRGLFVRINSLFEKTASVETQDKCEALTTILSPLLQIKMQDIDSDQKTQGICTKIDEYFENVTNLSTLKTAVDTMKNQFIHFLLKNRYDDKHAKEWLYMLNQHLDEDTFLTPIINRVGQLRREREQRDETLLLHSGIKDILTENKFIHIHGPQMQAIAAVDLFVNTHNLFFKLKTGQGKSLVAEFCAISMLKKNPNMKNVFIFTSYKHLAKRDQKTMEFLVNAYGYKSVLLERNVDLEKLVCTNGNQNQKCIIHVENETFRAILFGFFNSILNQNEITPSQREICNILFDFENNGLILDEFDLMTFDNKDNETTYHSKLTSHFEVLQKDPPEEVLKEWFFKGINSEVFGAEFEVEFGKFYKKLNERHENFLCVAASKKTELENKQKHEKEEKKRIEQSIQDIEKTLKGLNPQDQANSTILRKRLIEHNAKLVGITTQLKTINKDLQEINGFAEKLQYTITEEDKSSGKTKRVTYKCPFLKLINREFGTFNLTFLAYIRSFQRTLCLSGSIDESYMNSLNGHNPLFKKDNTEDKPNLFIDFPSFFGLQREGINRRDDGFIKCNTDNEWIEHIVSNIQKALADNQPILLFFDELPFKDGSVERIKNLLKFQSGLRIQDIQTEDDIMPNINSVGHKNTITFASIIVGRGVDFPVDEAITEGLHVIITFLPFKESDSSKVVNHRLITQMKGRTARQDRCGSFIIIAQDEYNKGDTRPEVLPKHNFESFDISRYFFSELLNDPSRTFNKSTIKKWVIYKEIGIPDDHELKSDPKAFVTQHVLR